MHNPTENASPTAQQKSASHGGSVIANIAFIVLSLLVISGSSFLILYATILHPAELKVQATAVVNSVLTTQAQATAKSSPQFLYTQLTNKPLTFNNSMNMPMGGWDIGHRGNSSCTFTNGAYHIHVASDQSYFFCLNSGKYYSNFVFQVQMTILNGTAGGLLLRNSNLIINGYLFTATSNGFYNTEMVTDPSGSEIFQFGRDATLHNNLKQSVLLTVIANGKHFMFYINKHFIGGFDDTTFSTGFISLIATNIKHDNNVDVAFNNAQLWIL